MKKAVKYSIIGACSALSVINAVRAANFTPEKKNKAALPDEKINIEKACAHLSRAISIPTVSYPEKEIVDFSQFDLFHAFLDETYPLIHEKLDKERPVLAGDLDLRGERMPPPVVAVPCMRTPEHTCVPGDIVMIKH